MGKHKDETNNYEIEVNYGSLTITPRQIMIKPKDTEFTYNDEGFMISELEFLNDTSLVEGHLIEIITSLTGNDIGTYELSIEDLMIKDMNGMDVTSNYEVIKEIGIAEVIPRPIVIRAEDKVKEYDGTPLESKEVSARVGTLVEGHYIVADTTGSQTEIGHALNIINEVRIFDEEGQDQTQNYEFTVEEGVLEVTPRYIEISTPSASKNFDNTVLTAPTYVVTQGSFTPNNIYSIEVTGSILYPGIAYNSFTITIEDEMGNDVSSNYVIKENIGLLEVIETRVILKIKSGSDSKEYDGIPLTKDTWEITKGALQSGHSIEVIVTGIIVEPGMMENEFEVIIKDENGVDVTLSHYRIDYFTGILIIFDGDSNGNNNLTDMDITSEGKLNDPKEGAPLFKVYSEISETLYLRSNSAGDYNTRSFDEPKLYEGVIWNPLQMPSKTLEENESYLMKLEALTFGLQYMMPYFFRRWF